MKTIASTEAKSNFGTLLDTAQREPVTIEKKGRPVAVMVSHETYQAFESLKLDALQRDLREGIKQADNGETVDGEEFISRLIG
jgi:prevent-host-death family protein